MVEVEEVYDALAEEVLEGDGEDLAIGQGRNYGEAKHRAWKALPEHVNLDKTEIIELNPERNEETFVAYRHNVKDDKTLYKQVIESVSSLFSSSSQREKEIHQIKIRGKKFSVDIEEAEDEYTDRVRSSWGTYETNKYCKTHITPPKAFRAFEHAKEKVKESQEKAALVFEQERVRRIAQIHMTIQGQELPDWNLIEGGIDTKTYQNPGNGEKKEVLETEEMRKALTYKNSETGQVLEVSYPDPEIGTYDCIDWDASEIYINVFINESALVQGEDGFEEDRNDFKEVQFDPKEPISVVLYEEGERKNVQKSKDHTKIAESVLEVMQ